MKSKYYIVRYGAREDGYPTSKEFDTSAEAMDFVDTLGPISLPASVSCVTRIYERKT